jgi:hypothetical protein
MNSAAIKENVKMEKRSWTPVEKARIHRSPVRSLEYDMNAAHLNSCKTMNTLIKTQNLTARINRVLEEKLREWFMNGWRRATSNKAETDYSGMEC